MAYYTVSLPLGMGRKVVGRVGQGVGFNAYSLRTDHGLGSHTGARIELTSEVYELANTQEHWSMEGRAIVREGTAEYYAKTSRFCH